MSTYRVGRSLGRTLYRNDELIGIEDAAMIVRVLNQRQQLVAATDRREVDDVVMAMVLEAEE